MRKNTKAKASTINRKRKETGGGPKSKVELNNTEVVIYDLLGETSVMGHKNTVESHAEFVSEVSVFLTISSFFDSLNYLRLVIQWYQHGR